MAKYSVLALMPGEPDTSPVVGIEVDTLTDAIIQMEEIQRRHSRWSVLMICRIEDLPTLMKWLEGNE